MSLPGNITTITVTGAFASPSGAAASGTVSFAPTSTLTDQAGQVILTAQPVVETLTAGAFSVVLPCTDNTAIRPTPFEYLITISVPYATVEPYAVSLPSTLGATVDLSALYPLLGFPSPVNGIYVISVNGQSGSAQVAPCNLPGTGAPTRWAGATAGGHPVSGAFVTGDWVIDTTGAIWICTAPGAPGTWARVGG